VISEAACCDARVPQQARQISVPARGFVEVRQGKGILLLARLGGA
jgi:hypothetical protein